jgi:hypothetical protein
MAWHGMTWRDLRLCSLAVLYPFVSFFPLTYTPALLLLLFSSVPAKLLSCPVEFCPLLLRSYPCSCSFAFAWLSLRFRLAFALLSPSVVKSLSIHPSIHPSFSSCVLVSLSYHISRVAWCGARHHVVGRSSAFEPRPVLAVCLFSILCAAAQATIIHPCLVADNCHCCPLESLILYPRIYMLLNQSIAPSPSLRSSIAVIDDALERTRLRDSSFLLKTKRRSLSGSCCSCPASANMCRSTLCAC